MKTLQEFLDKAEWEGGLSEFLLNYGYMTGVKCDCPLDELDDVIREFQTAFENLVEKIQDMGGEIC